MFLSIWKILAIRTWQRGWKYWYSKNRKEAVVNHLVYFQSQNANLFHWWRFWGKIYNLNEIIFKKLNNSMLTGNILKILASFTGNPKWLTCFSDLSPNTYIKTYLPNIRTFGFCCPSNDPRHCQASFTRIYKISRIHLFGQSFYVLKDSNLHLQR